VLSVLPVLVLSSEGPAKEEASAKEDAVQTASSFFILHFAFCIFFRNWP
jgi:hypothetical protein